MNDSMLSLNANTDTQISSNYLQQYTSYSNAQEFNSADFMKNKMKESNYIKLNFQTPSSNKNELKNTFLGRDELTGLKVNGKQNSIPNTNNISNQSRKITIHKASHNAYMPSEQSYFQVKTVQLQQQLLSMRKQMSLKQSLWLKQKTNLLNKIQICNYQNIQLKQRNNNLIQINQTLTHALGQTSKVSNPASSPVRSQKLTQLKSIIDQKSKTIRQLQQRLRKIESENHQYKIKYKEQADKVEYGLKTIQQYKTILKHSNQRKLESDERMMLFIKNLQLLKQKLNSLPIKDEYLHPIYAFLNSMSMDQPNDVKNEKKVENDRTFQKDKNYMNRQRRVQKYEQNIGEYLQQSKRKDQISQRSYIRQLDELADSVDYKGQNIRNRFDESQRIQTQEQLQNSHYQQESETQQVYLCEICQRIYPHQEFIKHMKDCQQYEQLLKQKRAIQSKLVSIKQQQYQNHRKSNMSSLNSSMIIMNPQMAISRSKSRGKFIKNDYSIMNHESEKVTKQKVRKGNKTERYIEPTEKSRLQLGQLLNISDISTRAGPQVRFKKGNYFPKQTEIKYQTNYQTNYQSSGDRQQGYKSNNVGKESMQDEIRKIIQTLNEGGQNMKRHKTVKQYRNDQGHQSIMTKRTSKGGKYEFD